MPGRPLQERLKTELNLVRRQLRDEVQPLLPPEWDWCPKPDMKSFRQHLLEIGTTEIISLRWIKEQRLLAWEEAWQALQRHAEAETSLLKALEVVRVETLDYLAASDEVQLHTPIPLPREWYGSFGGIEQIEPEELVREIARHEYYHLGQIITYRWLQGHNPYQSD